MTTSPAAGERPTISRRTWHKGRLGMTRALVAVLFFGGASLLILGLLVYQPPFAYGAAAMLLFVAIIEALRTYVLRHAWSAWGDALGLRRSNLEPPDVLGWWRDPQPYLEGTWGPRRVRLLPIRRKRETGRVALEVLAAGTDLGFQLVVSRVGIGGRFPILLGSPLKDVVMADPEFAAAFRVSATHSERAVALLDLSVTRAILAARPFDVIRVRISSWRTGEPGVDPHVSAVLEEYRLAKRLLGGTMAMRLGGERYFPTVQCVWNQSSFVAEDAGRARPALEMLAARLEYVAPGAAAAATPMS